MSRGKATEEMEKRFVEAFTGVAAGDQGRAAQLAGSKARSKEALSEMGRRMLQRKSVQALLEEKRKSSPLVTDGEIARELWRKIIAGEPFIEVRNGKKIKNSATIKERDHAAEKLGKAAGIFVRQVKVEHAGTVRIVAEIPDNGRDKPDDD